jgi:hypothetical protein
MKRTSLPLQRREFIAGLVGAAAWPIVPRAQQPPVPVIGFLNTRGPADDAHLVAAFRQGLAGMGYVEGSNVRIEYHVQARARATLSHPCPGRILTKDGSPCASLERIANLFAGTTVRLKNPLNPAMMRAEGDDDVSP